MRVLHLVSEPGTAGRGVPQKVARTVETWRSLGIDADHVEIATARRGVDGIVATEASIEAPRTRAGWILEMERRGRRLLDLLDRERPDLVYTRELVWAPAIESMFRRHRVVVEINSDRGAELRSASPAASVFWKWTSGRLLRRAAGIVAVTGELERRIAPRGIPTAVIANAADVPAAPPVRSPSSGRPLVLMLVGGANNWHGVDRVATLAESLPDIEFAVCGDLGRGAADLSPAVTRLPPAHGDDLDRLLARTTVGIGTLALSRKGMVEACPLKSRTMLAAGVPLIYAYDDPQLEGDEPFTLRVADRPEWSGDDLRRIADFVAGVARRPELADEAWRFARSRMDRAVVERRRLDFMRSLLPGVVA